MSQLRSDIWVSSFVRLHNDLGNFCVIVRKGHSVAGQIWIEIDHLDGTCSLYAPAPMLKRRNMSDDFEFELRLSKVSAKEISDRIEQELKYDPDIWHIALESRSQNLGFEIVKN